MMGGNFCDNLMVALSPDTHAEKDVLTETDYRVVKVSLQTFKKCS